MQALTLKKIKIVERFSIKDPIETNNTIALTEKGKNLVNLDPIFNLFIKFEELQILINEDYMTKIFYFNRKKVHEILYDEEEIITINSNEKKKSLDYLFYLVLLINDKKFVINIL